MLHDSCAQEEIKFLRYCELFAARLFTDTLCDNECLLVRGIQRYSETAGYQRSFEYRSKHIDNTETDTSGHRNCTVVLCDAKQFRSVNDQFELKWIERELTKAYSAFVIEHPVENAPAVATGNWGCGVFNGDKQLKFILQWIVACETQRPMLYNTYGDVELCKGIDYFCTLMTSCGVTTGDVIGFLLRYMTDRGQNECLFEFVIRSHLNATAIATDDITGDLWSQSPTRPHTRAKSIDIAVASTSHGFNHANESVHQVRATNDEHSNRSSVSNTSHYSDNVDGNRNNTQGYNVLYMSKCSSICVFIIHLFICRKRITNATELYHECVWRRGTRNMRRNRKR